MNKKLFPRRDFLKSVGMGAAAAGVWGFGAAAYARPMKPKQRFGPVYGNRTNVLLITCDDMSYDSIGAHGCPVPEITPNLDRLASEGIRFEHAHVNIAVCQPCRGTIATGRYAHRSGITGFNHTKLPIPTVMQTLKNAGYLTGIMSKISHSTPHAGFKWDMVVNREHTCNGRDPQRYYKNAAEFIQQSVSANRPFYLMVNSEDPHRPFAGAEKRKTLLTGCRHPAPSRTYLPEEVPVPGYLPDLPAVRKETAQYFSSVRRTDDTVGAVLRALKESGVEQNTMVVFISDHGRSFPFSKGNCYPFSTHVPWIMRLPGHIAPGSVDKKNFISTIDFFPTVLETLNLPIPEGLDGRSFLPLLSGKPQAARERAYTQFYMTSKNKEYPMRSVQEAGRCYIFNPWAKTRRQYEAEAMRGMTFSAMEKRAEHDPALAARIKLYRRRTLEELYDLEKDPDCLNNLADSSAYRNDLDRMRRQLENWMETTGDPALSCFEHRSEQKACSRIYEHRKPADNRRSRRPRRF